MSAHEVSAKISAIENRTGRRPAALGISSKLYMSLMEDLRRVKGLDGKPVVAGDSPPYILFEGVDVFPEGLGTKL